MISSDFNSIMGKIKVHLEDKYKRRIYDTDIAAALDISKEHFCRCKKNSKIPLESIISFCAKRVSLLTIFYLIKCQIHLKNQLIRL